MPVSRAKQVLEPLAAAEAAGPGLVRPGTSFVDRGRPALEVLAVQGGGGFMYKRRRDRQVPIAVGGRLEAAAPWTRERRRMDVVRP